MIDFKQIRITHIVNGLLVLTGAVFCLLCIFAVLKKKELSQDYDDKLNTRKNAYLYTKKDYTTYTQKIEERFPKLTPFELRRMVRYGSGLDLPSPTLENKKLAEQNVEQLRLTREAHERDLIGAGNITLTDPKDSNFEFTVQQNIRNYALKMRRSATEKGIQLDTDAVKDFGFSNYVSQSKTSNIWELAYTLDKQRAILEYLVGELLESKIHRLISVKRENLETKFDPNLSIAGGDIFYLNPLVSARVEGAIETLAFQLEFAGHTECLRLYFNKLSQFELPVVVRDVKVRREELREEEEEEEEEALPPQNDSPFPGSSPFPVPGSDGSPPVEQMVKKPTQKPVVNQNVSTFLLVIEFVELAKTEKTEEEDSDDN